MSGEPFPRTLRALLTETLPFELPLIFTNEFRYLALAQPPSDEKVKKSLGDLRGMPKSRAQQYTVPYNYSIRKDRGGSTTLSLIHPESQVQVALFYNDFAETILAACSLNSASLRRPTSISRVYTENEIDSKPTPKDGSVQEHADPEDVDVSRVVSFFTYRDFNLLAKFYESQAFIRIEKRFSRLRTLDISRCFYNIYTHSVTWAVKSKKFSKKNANKFSFEQQFDRLMQRVNYNETNGIVVGPEVSRIFAELIFQRIDSDLEVHLLESSLKLAKGRDYDFRRYVDDYFIYANDSETLDNVQRELEIIWEKYKLYPNESKITNLDRPFVTQLSTAKRQVRRAMVDLKSAVDDVKRKNDPKAYRRLSEIVKSKTTETRLIIGEHGVGFHNVSTWCLSLLNAMIVEMFAASMEVDHDDEPRLNCFERSIQTLISLTFYIVSLDVRVSTTYALGHLLGVRRSDGYKRMLEHSDWIDHVIEHELVELTTQSHQAFYHRLRRTDAVETLNLLILGSHLFGQSFVTNSEIMRAITEIADGDVSYFNYISLKFALLQAGSALDARAILSDLNAKAIARVKSDVDDIAVYSEIYLLLCDLLSAPDLGANEKRDLWKAVLPGEPSNATLSALGEICGFADWKGLRLNHTLKRRRLRPVYE